MSHRFLYLENLRELGSRLWQQKPRHHRLSSPIPRENPHIMHLACILKPLTVSLDGELNNMDTEKEGLDQID
ncbi:hypothetical protein KC19_12G090400 [Ceratodon purpureus]|uniref:Uncharacterized protein n=1 Tax=Ceratodon purpureus TaxID=3225 RepID=A0A8T0GAW2_CERPU|nr:hypothetical protein KC19_12G090400 [Ceratodon purpureus]